MLQRLEIPEKADPEEVRKRFDRELMTDLWLVPGRTPLTEQADYDPTAPWWWRGDEEASQAWLNAAGVILD